MQKTILLFICFLSLSSFFSCNGNQEDTTNTNNEQSDTSTTTVLTEEKVTKEEGNDSKYLITPTAFGSLGLGSKFADANNLEKGVLETGEGDFDVYFLKSDAGEELAYVLPNHEDASIVHMITVTAPVGKTEKGVHVGMTYGDFEKLVPTFEAHGSEIESRTYLDDGVFSYRLDVNNSTYDLDKNTIPKEAKIIEIILHTKVK